MSPLISTLKRVLKTRGVTYADLAEKIALSEASVKRLFSQGTFTLERLEQVCAALEIDVFELAKLSRGELSKAEQLSIKQEQALAKDRVLLGVFYLAYNGWQIDDIVAQYDLTRPQVFSLLRKLDGIGVLDLLAGDVVRVKLARNLRLRRRGPIELAYGRAVVGEFLSPEFDRVGGAFRFEFRELSTASFDVLRRKLERVADEVHELAELDSMLPSSDRQTVGVAVGIRPWTVSMVSGLPEKKR
ncbi:MAG: helix-turn-helix transcriptional regulator [Casimicrobium sp.]